MMKKFMITSILFLAFLPFASANKNSKIGSKTETKVKTMMDKSAKKTSSKIMKDRDPAKLSNAVQVEIKTSMGKIKVELFPDKAPVSVANFLKYVDQKFYDKTVFHRVMSNFMIQGGGFKSNNGVVEQLMTNKPIINEANNGLSNIRGTIACLLYTSPSPRDRG